MNIDIVKKGKCYQIVIDGKTLDLTFPTKEFAQKASETIIENSLPVGHPYQVGSEWYFYNAFNMIVRGIITCVEPFYIWENGFIYLATSVTWVDKKYGDIYIERTTHDYEAIGNRLREKIEDFIDV